MCAAAYRFALGLVTGDFLGEGMHRVLSAALVAAVSSVAQAADVGVSVTISEPGVYGRIDIGRFPQPPVVVPQPVIIQPPSRVVGPPVQPIYVWVPYDHRKHWSKHCRHYNACGVPVYFVRHDWYDREVRGHHGDSHGKGKGKGNGKGKGKGHENRFTSSSPRPPGPAAAAG
jgi:hypothetical protein